MVGTENERRLLAFGRITSLLAVILGLLGTAIWLAVPFLPLSLAPTGSMPLLTSVLVVASGTALVLSAGENGEGGRRRFSGWLIGMVALVAAIALVADLLGGQGGLLPAGPMATLAFRPRPIEAVAILLIAAGMLAGRRPSRQRGVVFDLFVLSAFALAYASLLVQFFGETIDPFALMTPLALALLPIGLHSLAPGQGVLGSLATDTPGGLVLRRVMPAVLLAPPALGWLRLTAERAGLIDTPGGLAVMVIALAIAVGGFTIWNARSLDRADAERLRALRATVQLAAIVEGSQAAIVSADAHDGRVLTWNPAAERLFGLTALEAIGSPLHGLAPAQKVISLVSAIERVQRGETVPPFETLMRGKSGRPLDVQVALSPVPDLAGGLPGISAGIVDITERKRAEQALRESEERYRRLVDLSPEAVMVDRQGRIVFANAAGAHLFGAARPEALVGRSLLDFLVPEDRPDFDGRIQELRLRGKPVQLFESRLRRSDGSLAEVETTASLFTFNGGPAMIVIMRDITARKRALEAVVMKSAELLKMAEMGRLKDHFLSTISHEMKTPLAIITGYAELLEDLGPTAEIIDGINDGVRRLTEHIEQMLDYSALISGTLPLYKTEVNFEEVAGHAAAILESSLQRRDLAFALDIAPDTPSILGDSRRITQMVLELLENALKFTPAGGTIGVRVGPEGHHVRIDVWDTGPGIPEQEFGAIWDAFHQLALDDIDRKGGLGLGLSIVKELVELHGGKVALVSQVGKGATFTVLLPTGTDAPGAVSAATPRVSAIEGEDI